MKTLFRSILVAALALAAAGLASASQAITTVKDTAASAVTTAKHGIVVAAFAIGEKLDVLTFGHLTRMRMVMFAVTNQAAYTGQFPVRMTPPDSGAFEAVIPITFSASAYAAGDLIGLCKLPAGVRVLDWTLITDDMDSGGSPAIAFTLGTLDSLTAPTDVTGAANIWASGITIGQTSGLLRATNSVAFLQTNTVERGVALKVTTIAATYVPSKTGVLILTLDY